MLRGIFLVLFALFIDGMQVAVGLAATAFGAVAGIVAGAAGAYSACSSLVGDGVIAKGCAIVGGLIGSFAQLFAVGGTLPIMATVGMALGVVISIVGGLALAFGLGLEGMMYPSYIFPGFLGEVIPGLNWLPTWTVVAILCVMRKKAEEGEGGLLGTLASGVTAAASAAKGNVGEAAQMANQAVAQTQTHSMSNGAAQQKRPSPQQLIDVRPRSNIPRT